MADYDNPVAGIDANCCNCCGVAASATQEHSTAGVVRRYERCTNCGHRTADYVPVGHGY